MWVMTLSDRGWKREPPTDPTFPRAKVRTPRPSRAFTPTRVLALLGLFVVIVLMLPRHIAIGGYHLHPGFAPYLVPYIFG
jgi:hypothetical protein